MLKAEIAHDLSCSSRARILAVTLKDVQRRDGAETDSLSGKRRSRRRSVAAELHRNLKIGGYGGATGDREEGTISFR